VGCAEYGGRPPIGGMPRGTIIKYVTTTNYIHLIDERLLEAVDNMRFDHCSNLAQVCELSRVTKKWRKKSEQKSHVPAWPKSLRSLIGWRGFEPPTPAV
jgi:hypothetical protein